MEKKSPVNDGDHRARFCEDSADCLAQAACIERKPLHQVVDPLLDRCQGLIITDIGNGISDESCNLFHLGLFQAMGGTGRGTDTDTGGDKR